MSYVACFVARRFVAAPASIKSILPGSRVDLEILLRLLLAYSGPEAGCNMLGLNVHQLW